MSQTAAPTAGVTSVLHRALAFKRRLREGGTVVGAWLSLNDPVAAEVMGMVGFDYLLIDTEHGAWDLQPLQTAIMALNGTQTVPVVRVPWNDHVRIKQVLDLGAEGILAPMVRTVDECHALVAACRYPPDGKRGFGPRRAAGYGTNIEGYMKAANEAIFVMPQIEDVATLEELDRFVAVPGIDAVAIGPNDLSGTAGLMRQTQHPTVLDAIDRIIVASKHAGLPVCLGVNTEAAQQRGFVDRGVRILLAGSDLRLLSGAATTALHATRQALAE